MTAEGENQMGDQVLDGIWFLAKNVILEKLKFTRDMGQTASHLSIIIISAPDWRYSPFRGNPDGQLCVLQNPVIQCLKFLLAFLGEGLGTAQTVESELVLRNGPNSLESKSACRKTSLPVFWFPVRSKDTYIISPK